MLMGIIPIVRDKLILGKEIDSSRRRKKGIKAIIQVVTLSFDTRSNTIIIAKKKKKKKVKYEIGTNDQQLQINVINGVTRNVFRWKLRKQNSSSIIIGNSTGNKK